MPSLGIAPRPGGVPGTWSSGNRAGAGSMRISGGRQIYTCWRLGFRQYSFNHIARVPQHPAPAHGHGRCFPGMLLSPAAFRLQVSHQTQEYPPNPSRLNREYNRAPRGAAMSLCTSIPATRSYSTFICAATSCSGTPQRMGTSAPPARAPDQYRRLTHAHAAATGVTRHRAPAPI